MDTKTRPSRNNMPLTPKVMANRRGGHGPERTGRTARVERAEGQAATPAMHITPNAIMAVGGTVAGLNGRSLSNILGLESIDRRRLRL